MLRLFAFLPVIQLLADQYQEALADDGKIDMQEFTDLLLAALKVVAPRILPQLDPKILVGLSELAERYASGRTRLAAFAEKVEMVLDKGEAAYHETARLF